MWDEGSPRLTACTVITSQVVAWHDIDDILSSSFGGRWALWVCTLTCMQGSRCVVAGFWSLLVGPRGWLLKSGELENTNRATCRPWWTSGCHEAPGIRIPLLGPQLHNQEEP